MIKKQILIFYLFAILFFCILFSASLSKDRTYEKFENVKVEVGNRAADYFHRLGVCILNKTDFVLEKDYSGVTFFEHLPREIPYDTDRFDQIHDELVANNITTDKLGSICDGCDLWEIVSNDRHSFCKIIRPVVHSIMSDAFLQSGLYKKVDYPVIHFRCADTPFIKHIEYHFQYYRFFKTALDRINSTKSTPYKKVYLMSCNTNYSIDEFRQSCVTYTDSLKTYLNDIGYDCEVVCGSNIEDFATLFYAPAVISTSSSFSFMSGYFGNGMFFSTENTRGKCSSCDEWMIYDHNLQHDDVEDYIETDFVISLLKK